MKKKLKGTLSIVSIFQKKSKWLYYKYCTKLNFRLRKIISTVSIISTVPKNIKWLYYKHSTKPIFKELKNYKTWSYNRVARVTRLVLSLVSNCIQLKMEYWCILISISWASFNLDLDQINKTSKTIINAIISMW